MTEIESTPSDKHREMMKTGERCAVTVTSDTGKISSGEIRIQAWDKKARTRRALKFWLYCWALSLLSIAIPLAHFFLVPGFFLVGPLGAWIVSTQGTEILGGESVCPDCAAFLPLSAGTDSWPLRDLCVACQRRMKIEKT